MISIEDGIDAYLKDVSQYPVLTRQEEFDLFERHSNGDTEARDEIIRRNLRFVVKMALGYQNQGVGLADLIQEGNIGLIEVVGRFDHRRGFRFSTYAAFWIKQAIQQVICRQGRLVRLPIRKTRALSKINEATRSFSAREGRTPTATEIADIVGVPVEQVDMLARLNQSALSIDQHPDDEDYGPSLQDVLPETDTPGPRETAMGSQLRRRVRKILDQLGERERRILFLRFGFDGGKGLSLRKTSAQVGLSQEGVRRIEQKTLKQLAHGAMGEQLVGLV